ncbi:cytochrome C [Desulfoplanes formicivorans]|uniref:Cytochrome C n=2 Tax=Desulfoplanes formicivorans TaxID=1592317 RepID=A0A194AJ37_9BACT|nr:cytochrome C [Desulfoplanes formicivorans]
MKALMLPVLLWWSCAGTIWAANEPDAPGRTLAKQMIREDHELWITADHSKFKQLQQPFASGPQVTRACLGCHTEAAVQFHKTIHWTWKDPSDASGKIGKAGITLNNF